MTGLLLVLRATAVVLSLFSALADESLTDNPLEKTEFEIIYTSSREIPPACTLDLGSGVGTLLEHTLNLMDRLPMDSKITGRKIASAEGLNNGQNAVCGTHLGEGVGSSVPKIFKNDSKLPKQDIILKLDSPGNYLLIPKSF